MDKPRRFDAYYFGFNQTNQESIDKILSALCYAGRGYHHTDGWVEPKDDYGDFSGGSYEGWIQNAANEAAQQIQKLQAENKVLREALGFYAALDSWGSGENSDGEIEIAWCDSESVTYVQDDDENPITDIFGGKLARETLKQLDSNNAVTKEAL